MPGFNITSDSGPSNTAEFHRSHRWTIESLGFPDGASNDQPGKRIVAGSVARNSGSGAGNPGRAAGLTLFAQSIQLPSLEFEEEQIKSASLVYRIAKRANWKPITIKFYDVWGLYMLFEEWQRKIWDVDRGIQAATSYKGTPIFTLTDGVGEVKQRYTLQGAYPQSITHGDLSYVDSNIKLLVVTYSFDYATIELFDEFGSGSGSGSGSRDATQVRSQL